MMEFDERLIVALRAVKNGDFSVRLPEDENGTSSEIATAFNGLMEQMSAVLGEVNRLTAEMKRVAWAGSRKSKGCPVNGQTHKIM
jgi:methyl-accepting chemotaxis protein